MSDRQAEKIARLQASIKELDNINEQIHAKNRKLVARAVDAEIEVKRAHDENRLLRAQKKRITNDLAEMTGSRDYWYGRAKNQESSEHVHNWVTRTAFDGSRKDTEVCTGCGLEFMAEGGICPPSDRSSVVWGDNA